MEKRPKDPTQSSSSPLSPVHPLVSEYINKLTTPYDNPVLLEMEELARQQNFPIIGRQVGIFIHLLTLTLRPKKIFEFGSGFGYSAYWFARAMADQKIKGQVICTEGDEKNVKLAQEFLGNGPLWDLIEYHRGWAQDVFQKTSGDFDIIYNDVDKDAYPEVWKLSRERIRPGGLYIADNTLWSGRVAQEKPENDLRPGWTEAIAEHNRLIAHDKDFDFFLNPVRDGVLVARRKGPSES